MIQEMYLILFTSLRYTVTVSSIVILVIFILSNIFMVINYAFKPITYFPNKAVMFIHLMEKFILPMFVAISSFSPYLIGVPLSFSVFRLLELLLNTKSYRRRSDKIKFYIYVTGMLILGCFMGILILIEKNVN